MYGLVNQAIEKLITEKFGSEKWDAVKTKAGVRVAAFANMDQYPDEITYNLVGAATEILELPQEVILEAFGEYWTLYTAEEGYEEFLEMGGKTVDEFLENLNNMHTRVKMMFDNLQPPVFKISEKTKNSLVLQYYSERPGLGHMVIGLVKGLGKRLGTELSVEYIRKKGQGCDHDQFKVTFGSN